jgi:hypothetical protein
MGWTLPSGLSHAFHNVEWLNSRLRAPSLHGKTLTVFAVSHACESLTLRPSRAVCGFLEPSWALLNPSFKLLTCGGGLLPLSPVCCCGPSAYVQAFTYYVPFVVLIVPLVFLYTSSRVRHGIFDFSVHRCRVNLSLSHELSAQLSSSASFSFSFSTCVSSQPSYDATGDLSFGGSNLREGFIFVYAVHLWNV